ncbi:MAG: hypothetical protein A2Z25_00905 [Planctomycetes bacterium RBG_16_55_9]|nr:MAG: hypothetical protein A2Z25_00905 [Planctomycetes bacterium RBG_16_55_9]
MKEETIETLVLEYISGDLTADREEALRSLLMKQGYKIDELNRLKEIYNRLDDVPIPPAGEKMTEGFYRMLEAYRREKSTRRSIFGQLLLQLNKRHYIKFLAKAACGIFLLFLGWLIGFQQTSDEQHEERSDLMSSEIREMKGMMALALLHQSSANERIRAIHQIKTSGSVDERMIALLLDTLRHDSNTNVRLVAVEALAAYADEPIAREGLVQSLDEQESPLVQLALADTLVHLKAKQAVEHFRRLLQRTDLNDVVRSRINDSLKMLM